MKTRLLVLGFHAFTHGFGWILLESPTMPLDWGVVERRKDRNAQCMVRFARLLDRHKPAVLAMEAYRLPAGERTRRICDLCDAAAAHTKGRGISVRIYPRAAIATAFPGRITRHQIAVAIAESLPGFDLRLPKKRAIWESERPNMALFNAAAVALTHYARTAKGASRLPRIRGDRNGPVSPLCTGETT
jgi:hypothetical protein